MKPAPKTPDTWPSWLAVALLSGIWLLPNAVRNGLASVIARVFIIRNSAHSRAVAINLQACFPDMTAAERRNTFFEHTRLQLQAFFVSPRLWWGSDESIKQHGRLHNRQVMDDAIARNQPIVLLVTHSVALDAGLLAVGPHYPLQGIYKPLDNRVLDWLVHRSRNRFNAVPVSRGGGFRALIKGLQSGVLLCYLSDEDLGPDGSVFAPFFGHQKSTLAMLPRIVRKTDAVVIPMIAHHDSASGSVDVHFFDPLPEHYPQMDARADATDMNLAIEQTIRMQPSQFFWKLRLFKTCPEGLGTRYGQIERGEIGVDDL